MKRIALVLLILGCMFFVFACERDTGSVSFTAVRDLENPIEFREGRERRAYFDFSLADKKTIYESYALARNSLPYTSTGEYAQSLRPLREAVCSEFWITDTTLSYIESEAYRNDWAPPYADAAAIAEELEQRHALENATLTRAPSGSFINRTYPSGSSSSSQPTAPSLSHSTRQKIYYDMIAAQDLNPYSNEWNEAVKKAAADYYNVPMGTINGIIHEGATEGWMQPDPP